jgi:hypothetical protein
MDVSKVCKYVCMYVHMYVGCGSSFWGTVDGRNLLQSADATARRGWLANNGWFGLCVSSRYVHMDMDIFAISMVQWWTGRHSEWGNHK